MLMDMKFSEAATLLDDSQNSHNAAPNMC
jgi:hypothetical protein